MFTSKKTCGFYDASINASMPDDVVEISAERHAELMLGQSEGKVIIWEDDGFPMLADPLPPSVEALSAGERVWRDQRLLESDGVVARHRDELEEGLDTTLTALQYNELQAYRRVLRSWPEAGGFPLIEHRPPAPLWLVAQIE